MILIAQSTDTDLTLYAALLALWSEACAASTVNDKHWELFSTYTNPGVEVFTQYEGELGFIGQRSFTQEGLHVITWKAKERQP